MRTTGMGAASGMARVAGVLAALLGGLLIPVSLGLTLSVYALSFALAALSVGVLGHETRDEALADTSTRRRRHLPGRAGGSRVCRSGSGPK